MNAFQLKYKMVDSAARLSDWMTEELARGWFDQLKANNKCAWCELLYTPEDEKFVLDEFVKA